MVWKGFFLSLNVRPGMVEFGEKCYISGGCVRGKLTALVSLV